MLHLPLRTAQFLISEFEKNICKYSIETHKINEFEKVVILEDALALYIGIQVEDSCVAENANEIWSWTKDCEFMDIPQKGEEYYIVTLEELTYNSLGFKYNHSAFIRDMEKRTGLSSLGLDVTYTKFRGYLSLAKKINSVVPDARLKHRYTLWEGIKYNFIVIEIDDINGNIEYGVAYTTQKPTTYINARCEKIIKRGICGLGDIRICTSNFKKAFDSWKRKSRKYRLENHMKYFYLDKYFKEKDDAWKYADKILEKAYNNEFSHLERSTYLRPINKWISEELVYNLTKKLYKNYNVIYQHKPFFLIGPGGGQMSYDVFIAGLNIAIEYQGKQHFEPVEFFGGEDAYKKTVERDLLKKQLSNKHGINLVYINYWEEISEKLLIKKIESLLDKNDNTESFSSTC